MALSIDPISMGMQLLAPIARGLGDKLADDLFGDDKRDGGPQMPQDSVHLSNPDDQHDDHIGKDIGKFLVKLCLGGISSATAGA